MTVSATSLAAYMNVGPHIPTCKEKVVKFLLNRPKSIGATCEEIAFGLPMLLQTVTARMNELAKEGVITRVSDHLGPVSRHTASGSRAAVWTLTKHRY